MIYNADYEVKQHILEINEKEYIIPIRTGKIEKKIKEHDRKIGQVSEYESNKEIIEILIGKNAFKEIFPKGEDESLDYIANVAYYAIEAFNADKNALEKEQLEKQIEPLQPVLDAIDKTTIGRK